jgi:hypothetical protein
MSKVNIFADVTSTREYELPEIYDGFTITLRKELSVGERRRAFADAIKGQTDNGDGTTRVDYDHARLTFGLVMAYLADWSEKVPITRDAVGALKRDVYEAIERVVDQHAAEYEPARPQPRQKASRMTKPSDAAISLSVAK